jgi:hypothetical protein
MWCEHEPAAFILRLRGRVDLRIPFLDAFAMVARQPFPLTGWPLEQCARVDGRSTRTSE